MIGDNNHRERGREFNYKKDRYDSEKENGENFEPTSGSVSEREQDTAAEVVKLRRELEDERNRHLRTKADFDNYRKRAARDAEAKVIQAKKEILLDLLNFIDYFEQARRQIKDPAAAGGIEIMARQLNDLLYRHGVRRIECLGEPYDPEEQEGIGYVETEECAGGSVAEEVCSGYRLGNILLRPARVMVARRPSETDKEETAEE